MPDAYARCFRLPVDLFDVHAQGHEQVEHLGPESRAAGVNIAKIGETQIVFQGSEHKVESADVHSSP